MSEPMIAIPKELRDKIIEGKMTFADHKALRAAPETVSLEGVERYNLHLYEHEDGGGIFKAEDGLFVCFSDLRRLVSPVQPSSVDIPCGQYTIPGLDGTVWKCGSKPADAQGKIILCDDCFGKLELWGTQLPVQPVAPVQSGDVDDRMWEKTLAERDAAEELIEQVAIYFGCTEEWSSVHSHFDCVREAIVAPLTTTQNAPSAESVPTVEADRKKAFIQIYDDDDNAYAIFKDGWDAALLTSRTEGK